MNEQSASPRTPRQRVMKSATVNPATRPASADQAKAASSNPTAQSGDRLDGHNALVENSVIAEVNATARWFVTLKPKHQDKLLKRIGAQRIGRASS